MFKIKDSAEKATIYIYGKIGDSWDEDEANRAKDFAKTLDTLTPKPLEIRIDSPGGDVFEGFAIASAIQRYEGETHAYIDGMAASAASYIAVMADKVTMNDFSAFMIHNAWGLAIGNKNDLRELADQLDGVDDSIARVISNRTGMELEDVKAAMDAETWYYGNDAMDAGFADEVIETERRIAACIDSKIAAHFKNIPEGVEIVDEAPEPIDGDPEPSLEELIKPVGDDAADDASHALTSIVANEGKDAEGAILLGNRVYRKENR